MASPLLDHLVAHARARPDAPFVRFAPEDARADLTYAATVELVADVAAELDRRGVHVGDRVVAQLPTSFDAITLSLAVMWAGAVFVPLNPALGADDTEALCADARPSLAIVGADALAALLQAAASAGIDGTDPPRGRPRSALHDLPDSVPTPHPRAGDDPASIIYTSGTTGRPKGAIVTHANLATNAEALCAIWGFSPDDVTVHALPTFHAHGLFVAVNTAIVVGSALRYVGRFDVDRVIDALRGPATVLMGVPTFYVRLLASERFTRGVAANVRLFVSGSAPLTEKVFDAFEAHTGTRILERYGMSETEMIASNPLVGERIAGSVGFALPDVEVRIRRGDDPAQPLADPHKPGGIEVRGPNVFAGYWGMPERRALDFTDDGWFRTGDLGTLDHEGRLRIVGRAKDLIISGGENIYPAELEAVLDQLPGVHESAVIGVPDDDLGEVAVAVVVPSAWLLVGQDRSAVDHRQLDAADVLAALADRFGTFKTPRRVEFVDALPRNAMGKVSKRELRDQAARSQRSAEE